MTEQPARVPMPLADAADAVFVARSPRKDSAHTTAAYRRDLRLAGRTEVLVTAGPPVR